MKHKPTLLTWLAYLTMLLGLGFGYAFLRIEGGEELIWVAMSLVLMPPSLFLWGAYYRVKLRKLRDTLDD